MEKIRIILAFCVFCFLGLGEEIKGCECDTTKISSHNESIISMKVIPDTISIKSEYVDIVLRNTSSHPVYFEPYYFYQKFTKKGWKDIKFEGINIGWPLTLHWLDSGQSKQLRCYLFKKGYHYSVGKYRLMRSFYFNSAKGKHRFCVFAEFFIM